MSFQHVVNSFEDSVGLGVAAPAGPPPFDDPNVVAIDFVSGGGAKLENKSDEKFHGDGFGPSDVSAILLPTREESPGLPLVTDDNAQASG